MGALTTVNGLFADAFYGKNYNDIDRGQFDTTWWYRTSFEVPEGATVTVSGWNVAETTL